MSITNGSAVTIYLIPSPHLPSEAFCNEADAVELQASAFVKYSDVKHLLLKADAAPDLLEALEAALDGVEGHHPLDADIRSWQDAARSAIAKARGEA